MPEIERNLLDYWTENDVFKKSITNRENNPAFVFFEGPPSANGIPGIHHVISRTLKDLVCRYKTMRGYQVNRRAGWDTHGLPVELGVEKDLGITKEDIGVKITVEEYNKKCREAVMRFKDKWDEITRKMGYWVDLENPYITFDNKYIESLWWALSELFKKDLLYKSVSIQPYSPAAGTGLSSHELNQPGTYKNVKDTSATVLFKLTHESRTQYFPDINEDIYVMAWTTTPWTLPSNLGLSVGPDIVYNLVRTYNPYTKEVQLVILAEALMHKYFNASAQIPTQESLPVVDEKTKHLPYQVLTKFKGSTLEGARYHQLFQFESNKPELSGGDPFRIVTADFVTTEDGTGIVHTAPAHGADDYNTGKKHNLGIINLVDREGKFVDGTGEFGGRYIKNYKDDPDYVDVNVDICIELKKRGQAFKIEKYEHSYPHCWRTDKPIIYYPLDAWFIRTTALKDKMIELNRSINWKPKSTGEGRFGNWLENMVDWNLSRSRFWGTPLPIWSTEDGKERRAVGSVAQLKEEIKKSIEAGNMPADTDIEALTADLHRPYIDRVILTASDGKPMKREPDLIDVWFDSGAMPFAQWHFPFENVDKFKDNYPADFIAEGVDQTRGWFYTLHALAALLQDSIIEQIKSKGYTPDTQRITGVSYKAVISNGLVLDKDGNKMSKRLGNVVDPFDTINRYSADATRWYLITNASPWDSLRFDAKGIEEVQRKFFGTLYNTYQFFALYANVDGFTYKEAPVPVGERPEMDQWIISCLNSLSLKVSKYMDDYEPTQAARSIEEFVDEQLSNWYVRLNRRRFWKGDYGPDKIAAYQTLYDCLETVAKLIAPFSPFFADWLYQNLNRVSNRNTAESVHLADFPHIDQSVIDVSLEERMQLAQDLSSLILSIRKKENIKVRQPLSKVLIPVLNQHTKEQVEKVKDIILSEVNVKSIEYLDPDNQFITKKIKPNFKTLGKKAGPLMKKLAEAIKDFTQEEIAKVESYEGYPYEVDGQVIRITSEDVEISAGEIPGWSVASKGSLTAALDITITEELADEGNARELINRLQKIRKDLNLEITDRIEIFINNASSIKPSVVKYDQYIRTETLADQIVIDASPANDTWEEIEINNQHIQVHIKKK